VYSAEELPKLLAICALLAAGAAGAALAYLSSRVTRRLAGIAVAGVAVFLPLQLALPQRIVDRALPVVAIARYAAATPATVVVADASLAGTAVWALARDDVYVCEPSLRGSRRRGTVRSTAASSSSGSRGRRRMDELLLSASVVLLAAAQVLQKRVAVRHLGPGGGPGAWRRALSSPEIWGAIACLSAGAALWLAVLYRMDVSKAFPVLSAAGILVLLASRVLLGERISARRWAGAILVAIGVALVAAS
jgi:multidrug transporter EmrE-like cation transporter